MSIKKHVLNLQLFLYRATHREYWDEVSYFIRNGKCVFPYEQIQTCGEIESGYDTERQLPFVMHKGKRLYFRNDYNINKCKSLYRGYIESECLLGGKYRRKQPHQYQTDNFMIEEGDVLVDVGCAEALLSLDNIDKVSKVYLFESEHGWIPALQATFENYRDKVVIFNKYVSGVDSSNTITLKTALSQVGGAKMFVKMDIEGAEVSVLKGSREFLTSSNSIKLACCTYHRHNDAREIQSLFEEMGYKYEFSDGYMYSGTNRFKVPEFRHGLIRGWK